MIYLDNSATTRPHKEVVEVMIKAMEVGFGNPSSLHRLGMAAEKSVRQSREQIAGFLGVSRDEIYFTSGGTASNNLSIIGAANAMARRGNHIITTKIEHPATLESCKYLQKKGFEISYLEVDKEGIVDVDQLDSLLTSGTILVSVMHVNNEIGTVQPIEKIGQIIKNKSKALFHVDAVQSFGKIKIPMAVAKIDLLSASGHKIHGPKGIGLIYIKNGIRVEPILYGGGQEKNVYPGTENTPAILGFSTATAIANTGIDARYGHVSKVKARLLEGIVGEIPDIKINGGQDQCLPYVLNVSFLGTRSEVLLHMLEQEEIYVSTGSACSSNKKGDSHVLTTIKLKPAELESAIRFSFSSDNTEEEMDIALEKLKKSVADMRKTLHGKFK